MDAWIAIAEGWFSLADTYVAPQEALPHIRSAVTHATAADPRSADAHGMLGIVLGAYAYDFRGAETEFQRALGIDTANVRASSGYAWQLWALGRPDSALAVVRRGLSQTHCPRCCSVRVFRSASRPGGWTRQTITVGGTVRSVPEAQGVRPTC